MKARGGRSGGRAFCFGVEAFDAARKAVFLEMLRRTANVTQSAGAAGVAANTAYRHRALYPAFRAAWAVALEQGLAGIEAALFEGEESRLRQAQTEREHSTDAKARGDIVRLMKAHKRGFGMEARGG